ncbi:MAG TPA: glycoside hydrolase family 88 protein [Terriglobales bacterium]
MKFFGRSKFIFLLLAIILVASASLAAQEKPWSQRMATSTMQRWPNGRYAPPDAHWVWNYELGVVLNGMNALWYNTADRKDYEYLKQSVDQFVQPDGTIATYNSSENSLDSIGMARAVLLLYRVTREAKYYKAAKLLRDQLSRQPRTPSGGFWHKQLYPDQMWLDGLYMAEPFYAEYAYTFQEPNDFKDITKQFVLIESHTRDHKTGLLYHAWDESKKQPWANPKTGASPSFWSRSLGWYMMALVDTLPYYKQDDPGRVQLLAILNRTAKAVARVQDKDTGLWYQVPDKPDGKGNYFESSGSCMFAYAFAKGVRLGYLPASYSQNAQRAWQGILSHFIQVDSEGSVTLTKTVKGLGLGGHADGSYEYYVNVPTLNNDPKGVGAFLLAASELEIAPNASLARGAKVTLDGWFNSQQQKNAAGQTEYFHYKWDDYSNSGFSLLGHIFRSDGAFTGTLYSAPTLKNLKDSQIYIIVSPDIPAKNPNPHYAQPRDADQIARWVRQGGVLVLMENDSANADIDHLDLIADKFGIHFNSVLSHHVVGDQIASGTIQVTAGDPIFHHDHTLYMKDTCTISVKNPATSLLQDKGDIMMATAKYGKGTVWAVVDPWLYNEYTDGRKLSQQYDNFAAGKELVEWLLKSTPLIVE